MNFSEVKSVLESITTLVKKTATLDLQEKIVELREYIISLKDENISLKEENQTLKTQLNIETNFIFKDGKYWKENDTIPFCQRCLDADKKSVRLQRYAEGWKCFECSKYYDPRAGFVPQFRASPPRHNIAE